VRFEVIERQGNGLGDPDEMLRVGWRLAQNQRATELAEKPLLPVGRINVRYCLRSAASLNGPRSIGRVRVVAGPFWKTRPQRLGKVVEVNVRE